MNTINQIEIHYLRTSRTIETIAIENLNKVVYVYNYEGNHFRLFKHTNDLIRFFQFGTAPKLDFSNEDDLNNYLINKLEIN